MKLNPSHSPNPKPDEEVPDWNPFDDELPDDDNYEDFSFPVEDY